MPLFRLATGLLALRVLTTIAVAQTAREIGRQGAWTVLVGDSGDARTCFAIARAKPSPRMGSGRELERESAYLYVSAWPKDGVKAEVSVSIGHLFQPGSPVTLTIGSARFQLFTAGNYAFVADPIAELKLIDAMKKGSSMQVQAIDEDNRSVTDTYSLGGLTQTLVAITQACG